MTDINKKLTEDETVELLVIYLKSEGYKILDYCKGHRRGIDITTGELMRDSKSWHETNHFQFYNKL